MAERAWVASLVGSGPSVQSRDGGASLSDRVTGARVALLDGAITSDPGQMLALCSMAAVLTTAIAMRRVSLGHLVGPVLVIAAGALLVRLVVAPEDPADRKSVG